MTDLTDYLLPDRAVAEFGKRIDLGARRDVALRNACRISVAEELRRLAEKYKTDADKERNRSIRLEASGAPKWQYEASITSAQELMAFVRDLHTRANELDPEGAQR